MINPLYYTFKKIKIPINKIKDITVTENHKANNDADIKNIITYTLFKQGKSYSFATNNKTTLTN